MEILSRREEAFIRPSPTRAQLGGVAQQTQAAILLCEAAAYDIIIVETVGVGQSEIAVNHMVDLFVLLQIVGAGDDIQAMKRGVLEWVDLILFNKADKGKEVQAQIEAANMTKALTLFPKKHAGWTVPVLLCSALEKSGIEAIWEKVVSHQMHLNKQDVFQRQREDQLKNLLHSLEAQVLQVFFEQHKKVNVLKEKNRGEWKTKNAEPFRILTTFTKQLECLFPEQE